ncbi:hotdog fold thioesterase [Escherichia coli]|nr:hotdog fold thioesterase [Escherichia coli]
MSNKAWQMPMQCMRTMPAPKPLGIDIISMDEGFAVVNQRPSLHKCLMRHQSCHGGQPFSLADTAFAYACNSQGWQPSLLPALIDFFASRLAGDTFNRYRAGTSSGQANRVFHDIEIR